MMKEILLNPAVISVGVGLGIVIAGRLISDEWLRKKGESHADFLHNKFRALGRFVSKYMGVKLGKKCWEKIETRIEKWGTAYFKGLMKHGIPIIPAFVEGLNEDDKVIGMAPETAPQSK